MARSATSTVVVALLEDMPAKARPQPQPLSGSRWSWSQMTSGSRTSSPSTAQ
jgi:hypothetical protein